MTGAEFMSCNDPEPLLEFLRGRASERKLRLFACACCRQVWLMLNRRIREAIRVAERYADGHVKACTLRNATQAADHGYIHGATWFAVPGGRDHISSVLVGAINCRYVHRFLEPAAEAWQQTAQARLLHDLFGHLFSSARVDPLWLAWNDGTVRRLAQTIYNERAFDQLPILADALEDAGCVEGDILDHCRQPGEHVRGCWPLDLLLEKE